MEMLNIKINGKDYQVEKNTTILEACHKFGIKIPHHPGSLPQIRH